MKAQSLQDAIKAAANDKKDRFSRGEWKDPVVKQHKVTAEDMQPSKGPHSNGGGPNTDALQREIEMLRQEMRSSLKQMKDEQLRTSPSQAINKSSNDDADVLKRELESVQADLRDMRSVLSGVEHIPNELQELREDLRDVQERSENTTESTAAASAGPNGVHESNGGSNGGSGDDSLLKDVKKVKSEIKELRMMVVQSKDSSALAKELRVIVDQQETMLETHAEEIDELKEQVRLLKRRLETAEFNAKEAMDLAQSRPSDGGTAPNGGGDYHDLGVPSVPQVIPMSPTNRPPRSSRGSNNNNNSSGSSNPLHFEEEEEPPENEDDEDESDNTFLSGPMMKDSASRSRKDRQQELYGNTAGETNSNLLHLDSDDDESTDGSDLYPINEDRTPSSGEKLLLSRRNSADNSSSGGVKKKTFSPSSIVLDKDGTYNYNTTDDDNDDTDNSDDDSELYENKNNRNTSSTPSLPSEEKGFHKLPPARSSSFDRDIEHIPRAGASRPSPIPAKQSQNDPDDSSSSESDVTPKKKTISLLPHRSDTLYQEQRKDSVLRKFIANGKTPNMTVHKVHGKNLVFFSDKVYIPASLRQQSMEYYHKKHSYNPLFAIQKHCFWPDMEDDMNKFGKKDTRWRVVPSAPKETVH